MHLVSRGDDGTNLRKEGSRDKVSTNGNPLIIVVSLKYDGRLRDGGKANTVLRGWV